MLEKNAKNHIKPVQNLIWARKAWSKNEKNAKKQIEKTRVGKSFENDILESLDDYAKTPKNKRNCAQRTRVGISFENSVLNLLDPFANVYFGENRFKTTR